MRLGGFGTTLSKVFFVSFGQTLFNMALNSLSFSLRLSEKKEEFGLNFVDAVRLGQVFLGAAQSCFNIFCIMSVSDKTVCISQII